MFKMFIPVTLVSEIISLYLKFSPFHLLPEYHVVKKICYLNSINAHSFIHSYVLNITCRLLL